MRLALVVERRAPKPKDALVSEWCTMRPLSLVVPRARRTEMHIARVERCPVLEYEARVMVRGTLRVVKGSWTELPVRVVHRKVAARLEATAALEEEDAHPRLGEAHRCEAAAGP